MLRDDLFTLLSQRLGNRADLVPRMELEVTLLQSVTLEQHTWLPWFLETSLVDLATISGEELVDFPTGFLREKEDDALWLYDSTAAVPLTPLAKLDYDDMVQKYPGAGAPKAYALGSTGFYLRYIPDQVYSLKLRYFAQDVTLSTNVENKWLTYAPDVVLAELGIVMAEKHMQYFELAQTFRKDAEVAWNRLYTVHIARQEDNMLRKLEA